ncbi:cytochrome b/b6 domain-containing protein [uncultured Nevskia sp.]|uniref:cytochrome b/b6 domain-containing protein n=1 Tax=uncultured Nevskia sp. TaxID=228950 RepID=UPI0025D865A9|nr:cytochrome b/b6 domain-containing protein [uncultured Nevskia sp.]
MSSIRPGLDTAAPAETAAPARDERRVWDLPVRVFHWTLVAGVLASYVTSRLGPEYFSLHLASGYLVTVLVAFRMLWGLFGTRHARFASFVQGPRAISRYATGLLRGKPARHAGHNPLGALMVLALLAMLFVQASTGLFSNDEIFNVGPLYAWVSEDFSLQLTAVHKLLFNWIAAAILIHVLAILVHRLLARENLVRAMWTGRKPAHAVNGDEVIGSSRLVLALLLLVIVITALAWLVTHAPAAGLSSFE